MHGELASWASLTEAAGEPQPRTFPARERLFGAKVPEFRFWHDAAGWCPSCAAVFMVLEEMRVPYVLATGPLGGYMKPGEKKPAEFLKIRPNGIFPVIQFAGVSHGGELDGEVVSHGFRILEVLKARYPDQACLPRTSLRRRCADALGMLAEQLCYAVEGRDPRSDNILDDLDAALSGGSLGTWGDVAERPWVDALEHLRLSDDADGDATQFGGSLSSGPFLFGSKPCAVDVTMLPWISIKQARLPDGVFEAQWPAVGEMLAAARKPGMCSCYEICFDKATLRGLVGRRDPDTGPVPHKDVEECARQAASSSMLARRDAAARVCANHTATARFARNGNGMWAAHRRSGNSRVDAKAAEAAVDSGLRMISAALLFDQASDSTGGALKQFATEHAITIRKDCGNDAAKVASDALLFLSGNVGVPRDMEPAPADALRAHAALAALLIGEQASDWISASL